jgi:hypothetical protein
MPGAHKTVYFICFLVWYFGIFCVSWFSFGGIRTLMTRQKIDTMPETKKANRQLDEELIRKTEAAYDHAWQQGDIEGIMV